MNKIIFIVPYRNREPQKNYFLRYKKYILEDLKEEDYEIVISHQTDNRPFNRGAVKNIGFLYVKNKYPDDYKNFTFVFNDLDTMPAYKNTFDYKTEKGVIKHFYGFQYALGGIVSINGEDFEKINGYPNYWSWSLEDNCLQARATKMGLKIDRSVFFQIGNINVLHIHDGIYKDYSETNLNLFSKDTGNEGLLTINKLHYDSKVNKSTNCFVKNIECNIIYFETLYSYKSQASVTQHNITAGNNLSKKKQTRLNSNFRQLVYR